MINSKISNQSLEQIQNIISIKFGLDLNQQQVLNLIEVQAEDLKKALLAEKVVEPANLHILVESISDAITGMHYPTESSTAYFKEYFQMILLEKRASYFSKL